MNGRIELPTAPGLGIELDEAYLLAHPGTGERPWAFARGQEELEVYFARFGADGTARGAARRIAPPTLATGMLDVASNGQGFTCSARWLRSS